MPIYNYFTSKLVKYWNPRYNLLDNVLVGKANFKNDFQGIQTYKRNIEHLIKICKSSNIDIIFSSFVHYLYSEIKGSKLHQKLNEGVSKENYILEKLAKRYELTFIKNSINFPLSDEYFVDSIHFSPKGMDFLATSIFEEVKKKLS